MSQTEDGPRTHDVVQINATQQDKWRYRCPRRHSDWHVINGVLLCRTCQRHANNGKQVDPNFREVLDTKTGDRIPRDRIRIQLADGETIKW